MVKWCINCIFYKKNVWFSKKLINFAYSSVNVCALKKEAAHKLLVINF